VDGVTEKSDDRASNLKRRKRRKHGFSVLAPSRERRDGGYAGGAG
jgi:hypothetical protein